MDDSEESVEVEAVMFRDPYMVEYGDPGAKSPHDLYFDRLREFKQRHKYIGSVCIRGLPSSEDLSTESDNEGLIHGKAKVEDTSSFTEEQMQALRYIMLDNDRSACLDEMEKFVLQDQAEREVMSFSTSYSFHIHSSFYETFVPHFRKLKSIKKKFNLLFAYTFNLLEYDVWMRNDHGYMSDMVLELGDCWTKLLKKSNKVLGIDSQYTRPAIMAFLGDFKREVEAVQSEPPFQFSFE